MDKRELISNVSFQLPVSLNDGLDAASKKFGVTKSDILRSISLDFLVASGVLDETSDFDSSDDVIIERE